MSYDMIDRFLRNNLGDDDYAEYSAALDELVAPPKQDVPETNFGNMADPKIGCVNHDCDKCKAVQEPAPKTWELTTPATALSGGSGSGSAPVQEAGARVDAVVAKIKAGIAEKPTALNSYGLKLWDSVRDDLLALVAPPAPQPVPVKTYHDGKPWPVQPKPWVGLTDEEVVQCQQGDVYHFYRCIEAKLKEKNT
jgi:hypothetical protein